jgi:hypothetical protein
MVTGCVSIPSDGPVVKARPVEGGRAGAFQYYPAGPSIDDTPGELIRGFLRASVGYTDDHGTARGFLTPEQRRTWRPESSVVVYAETGVKITVTRGGTSQVDPGPALAVPVSSTAAPSSPSPGLLLEAPPVPGERATVTVQVHVNARIDKSGRFTSAAPEEIEIRHFTLLGTADGWRISDLDQGIMITREYLKQTFRRVELYFADPTGTYLVPDLRWFPADSSSMPSQVVSALLAGPVDWLEPAVTTGVPVDTKLTVNSVKIVDGVVTIDLNSSVRTATATQRVILKAQLERTIAALGLAGSQTKGVEITVEQQKFELRPPPAAMADSPGPARTRPEVDTSASRLALRIPPQVDARPVVLDSRGLIARSGVGAEPVDGLEALAGKGVSDPATNYDGSAFAVLAADRTRLQYAVPYGRTATLAIGRSLVPPSFDPFGWVWTSEANSPGTVLAARHGSGVWRVSAGWLQGRRIRSLRISREGVRALVVTDRPGTEPEVFVTSVIRSTTGGPIALSPPIRLLEDARAVSGAAWVTSTRVVVLARRPGSASQPWIVEVGGDANATGTAPIEGIAVTAGNSESDLYVQVAGGGVRARVGAAWMDVPGVRYASMPG